MCLSLYSPPMMVDVILYAGVASIHDGSCHICTHGM